MSDTSKQEHHERALESLIVSQLRSLRNCDEVDVEHLPRLTNKEREALDSLGSDFVQKLLAGDIPKNTDKETSKVSEMVLSGELVGMNRAEEVDEVTTDELNQRRKEIIERIKREEDEKRDHEDT